MSNEISFTWDGAGGPSGPWDHLQVARFDGREAMSSLTRYELILLAQSPAPEVDPEDLIGRSATLRIATQSVPAFKVVHGVIAEAREIAETPFGLFYEVVLMPPWSRAKQTRRSRIFLDKTLRQIIDAVLAGDPKMGLLPGGTVDDDDGSPAWSPPEERYTWRVNGSPRLDDARVRSYTVQYNETDHDFVARLLEEEGFSYHFEDGLGRSLLVISSQDAGRARLSPDEIGPAIPGRTIDQIQLGARMRPGKITLDDYNWKRPKAPMRADVADQGPAASLTEYVYPGGYPDSAAQGNPLSTAVLDRYAVEADFATGSGPLRVLSAGTIVKLLHPKPRYEGEYLITELLLRAEQSGVSQVPGQPNLNKPFEITFEAARRGKNGSVAESRFRPAKLTQKPRIRGAQTAVVTAEPGSGAEVNVGGPDGLSIGCVRLKFHWDDETARHAKEATSCWVRVSQVFAGAGQGAVWHPRVGVEVIVEFEEGNPDRPLVTGRVYNGKNLPPYGGSPVHSTYKSLSTPGGATHNEFTFNDTAGAELLHIHAGKDMTTRVLHDRLETVGNDATMNVGAENVETIGVNCDTTVGSNDTMTVGANQVKTIGANRKRTIGANQTKTVGANETRTIGGNHVNTVSGSLTETVGGAVTETYKSTQLTHVTSTVTETFKSTRDVTIAGMVFQSHGGFHHVTTKRSRDITVNGLWGTLVTGDVTDTYGGPLTRNVGGIQLTAALGGITHLAPSYTINTPLRLRVYGLDASIYLVKAAASAFSFSITGISLSATGLSFTLPSALELKNKAPGIEGGGPTIKIPTIKIRLGAVRISVTSIFIFI